MKKIGLASLLLAMVAVAPAAQAQCPPGSWLCADIQIGTSAPPPPPPTVVVTQPPPPPTVYVVRPPPPPTVYVVRPPVVVYQPAQPVYYQQPTGYYAPPPPPRRGFFGIQASVVGAPYVSPGMRGTMNDTFGALGGFNAGLRFRNNGYFGGEIGIGVMGGRDYNGDDRIEIPLTLTGLVYFNPGNRFQVFGLAGLGFSFADVRYNAQSSSSLVSGSYATNVDAHAGRRGANYGYVGGHIGIGAELQLSPRFSLFADIRGFVRGRVDDETRSNPEFARNLPNGTTQTTNTSVGMSGQLGAILYF